MYQISSVVKVWPNNYSIEAASYARENGYKMEAVCSYVVAAFEKSDAYNDVKQ